MELKLRTRKKSNLEKKRRKKRKMFISEKCIKVYELEVWCGSFGGIYGRKMTAWLFVFHDGQRDPRSDEEL